MQFLEKLHPTRGSPSCQNRPILPFNAACSTKNRPLCRCSSTVRSRFVKQEQWERWRDQRKLVSAFKHLNACGSPGYHPAENFEIVYAKSCNLEHFAMGVIKTLTMGTAFSLEITLLSSMLVLTVLERNLMHVLAADKSKCTVH